MIRVIAAHKFAKLRSSKMIIIFLCGAFFFVAMGLLPPIIIGLVTKMKILGPAAANMYFGVISFVGTVAALLIGVTAWRSDVKDGTIVTFMARPISRLELLFGKLLGCLYALSLLLGILVAVYLVLHLIFFRFELPLTFLLYLLQILAWWLAVFAIALFFSSFANSLGAAAVTVGYFALGILSKIFSDLPPAWARVTAQIIDALLPSQKPSVDVTALQLPDFNTGTRLLEAIAYYILWIVLMVSASALLFRNREIASKRG